MKLTRMAAATVALSLAALAGAQAADETRTFQLKNRLRVEYDDNVYERNKDTQDSFKIIEEAEFVANLNFQQTYIGLRYRPTFVWWSDRDPDDTDLHHDFDFIFAHNFSPRLTLNVKETLRVAEEPKEIDRGAKVRENDDYIYNVVDGSLNYRVSPQTRLDLGGRYTLLRFDREEVSDTDDYDIYAGGLTLRQDVNASTVALGEYRYETIEYEDSRRDSESHYVGVGAERIFSPNLLGNIRGGAQFKTFDNESFDDETSPYVDGSFTYLPSPRTRLTAGVGYSLFEADVTTFANQERFVSYISAAHDLTARVSLYAAASYQLSQYQADQSTAPKGTVLDEGRDGEKSVVDDGDENVVQFSLSASYKINRRNWLEAGWQYLNLDSDLREDFDRNRLSLGWRTEL